MFRTKGMTGAAAVLAVTAGWAFSAQAALVTIFDPNGLSDFSLTYDDEQSGPFGTPQLSNNTVFFVPNDFVAQSANGLGQGSMNDSFAFRLDVLAGNNYSLDQFNLTERGDYQLDGAGAEVAAQGQLQVFNALDPSQFFNEFLQTGPLNINDNQLHNWTGTAGIDGTDGWNGSRSAWVTIENLLTAETAALNEFAFIEKKFAGGAVQLVVTQVPVPGAIWLLGGALLALLGRRR